MIYFAGVWGIGKMKLAQIKVSGCISFDPSGKLLCMSPVQPNAGRPPTVGGSSER
jgi:hypothetical protein